MAKKSEFHDKLENMDGAWNSAKPANEGLEEGTYEMQIQEVQMKETTKGDPRVAITYLVTEGEQAGELAFDGFVFLEDKPFGMRLFKSWLQMLGKEVPESFAEIEDLLQDISAENPLVMAKAVQSKGTDFVNIKILELVDATSEAVEPEAAGEEAWEGTEVLYQDEDVPCTVTVDGGGACITIQDADGTDYEVKRSECTQVEVEVDPEEAEAGKADEVAGQLLELASACGIEDERLNDELSTEEVVAILSEYNWPEANKFLEEEVALLESNGIELPKAKAAKKKTVTKKKTTTKPAAKKKTTKKK